MKPLIWAVVIVLFASAHFSTEKTYVGSPDNQGYTEVPRE